jgi:hypothetical protein
MRARTNFRRLPAEKRQSVKPPNRRSGRYDGFASSPRSRFHLSPTAARRESYGECAEVKTLAPRNSLNEICRHARLAKMPPNSAEPYLLQSESSIATCAPKLESSSSAQSGNPKAVQWKLIES